MRDFSDAKTMAKVLRSSLAENGVALTHAQSLELVARQFDMPDWNVLSARITAKSQHPNISPAIPIIRSFDAAKAQEFYVDYLGFAIDWQHRFEAHLPLYMQVSRSDCQLHISEHHGDATPGGRSFIPISGIKALHRELKAKGYANINPGIEQLPWGLQVSLTDPFGNRLTFCEQNAQATET
ncbi:Glyoxalase-like domain protein [Phaeobacter sp. CECT 5382]|uniref:glyoxalase superfamily protein n=1 Tax=Phaeobacter sp. CECT 5382 TaxID=1712645 RepID=UPI0006DA8700|nr:glyoxalase superfamily protein [Phaeobacter sp. CECT 5382]CUH86190.1 Glyoxalase-like domain protein [Phaeobacter sp. CECT 5382]